jgi:hypoxia up-regulated 1
LAGLEPVVLVSDNVALAYKYAISRNPREIMESKLHKKKKDDVHHALLYDIGATGATASLVRVGVSTKTKGRKMSVVETVDVKAVAWSEVVGGRSFDRRLSELLAERYNALQAELGSTTFDVREDPRAMATLLREAARIKEKLSANKELAVSIEGLPSDVAVRAHRIPECIAPCF